MSTMETIDMLDQWPPSDGRWTKTSQNHHNIIRNLANTVRQLRNDFDNMKFENNCLKSELEELKKERDRAKNASVGDWATIPDAVLTDKTNTKKTELRLIAKMHEDMKERNKIEKILIVSGLPEDADQAIDVKSVEDLVTTLDIDASRI